MDTNAYTGKFCAKEVGMGRRERKKEKTGKLNMREGAERRDEKRKLETRSSTKWTRMHIRIGFYKRGVGERREREKKREQIKYYVNTNACTGRVCVKEKCGERE